MATKVQVATVLHSKQTIQALHTSQCLV